MLSTWTLHPLLTLKRFQRRQQGALWPPKGGILRRTSMFLLLSFLIFRIGMHVCLHSLAYKWRSEGNQELLLSSHPVGSWDQTRVSGLTIFTHWAISIVCSPINSHHVPCLHFHTSLIQKALPIPCSALTRLLSTPTEPQAKSPLQFPWALQKLSQELMVPANTANKSIKRIVETFLRSWAWRKRAVRIQQRIIAT